MEIKKAKLLIVGKTGKQYQMQSFPIGSKLTNKSGIYVFLICRLPSCRQLITGGYSSCIAKDCVILEKDAIKRGANFVAVLPVKAKVEALKVLEDIQMNW